MTSESKSSIVKEKKKVEFNVNSIDNTAPTKKIVENLFQQNGQAFTFVYWDLKKRSSNIYRIQNYHCDVTGHPLFAYPDSFEGDLKGGHFIQFNYKSLMPIIITNLKNVGQMDPLAQDLHLKHQWYCTTQAYKTEKVNLIDQYEQLNEEIDECPQKIVDMARHLENDPDPYLDISYNWYYAGNGNMQHISINWVDYILHSEFSCVYLTQFSKSGPTIEDNDIASFDFGEEYKIFETICSSQQIVAIRTKYKIHILKIVLYDNSQLVKIAELKHDLPFTGINFDDYHKNILYAVTLDNKLKILNIDRTKVRTVQLDYKLPNLKNNWSTVFGCGRGLYCHVTRTSVIFYDKRTNTSCHTWSKLHQVTDHRNCDYITVARRVAGKYALYFGTDHHLFLMEYDHPNVVNCKVVQRWTHGMQSVPTYMSICNFGHDKIFICLSSQWCEDMCVVNNYSGKLLDTEIKGISIPYRPPSILKAVLEAQEKKLCTNIYNSIERRISTAITGCLIFEFNEKYYILMHNSLGDITSHTLLPKHLCVFIEDDAANQLHNWFCSHREEKEFTVTSVNNIAHIFHYLRKAPVSRPDDEDKSDDDTSDDETESAKKSNFNEQEIYDTFEKEEVDQGILDLWVKDPNETTINQSKSIVDDSSFLLHYSDSDGD